MTPQQIVGLGIRLLAVWLAITSFQYFVLIPGALNGARLGDKSTQAYVIAGAYAVCAVLLWLFPMWTAHKLLPRTRFENSIKLQAAEAARVGCALIGLWLSTQGFLNTIWYLFRAMLVTGSQSVFESLGREAQLEFMVTLATLSLGLLLVFRSGTFAAVVVGRTEVADDDGNAGKVPSSSG